MIPMHASPRSIARPSSRISPPHESHISSSPARSANSSPQPQALTSDHNTPQHQQNTQPNAIMERRGARTRLLRAFLWLQRSQEALEAAGNILITEPSEDLSSIANHYASRIVALQLHIIDYIHKNYEDTHRTDRSTPHTSPSSNRGPATTHRTSEHTHA
jgi:hypothetical protein